MDLDEIDLLPGAMVMLLVTFEGARASRVDRLIEEGAVAHPDDLALVDVIAFGDQNIRFAASGVIGGDI